MAKKTKKKAKQNNMLDGLFAIVGAVLSLVAAILLGVLPMVVTTETLVKSVTTYTGFGLIFGGEATASSVLKVGSSTTTSSVTISKLGANTLVLVAFILAVVTVVGLVVSAVVKGKVGKFIGLVCPVVILVAGILMFASLNSTVTTISEAAIIAKNNAALGAGPIVSGILSILAAVVSALPVVRKVVGK